MVGYHYYLPRYPLVPAGSGATTARSWCGVSTRMRFRDGAPWTSSNRVLQGCFECFGSSQGFTRWQGGGCLGRSFTMIHGQDPHRASEAGALGTTCSTTQHVSS